VSGVARRQTGDAYLVLHNALKEVLSLHIRQGGKEAREGTPHSEGGTQECYLASSCAQGQHTEPGQAEDRFFSTELPNVGWNELT